jgi:type II secretory pathway pseudopilin PulG
MKKGQILLITVMILATALTVVLSVSFHSVVETQVTKLEEESQKALAAAESAIDVALKNNATATLGAGSLSSFAGSFTGSATIDTATSKTFTTSLIPKNGSYTFYLGDYDVTTKTIGASDNKDITLCFQSGTTNPAVEVTLVKTSGVKKYMIDPSARVSHASTGSVICTPNSGYGVSTDIPGVDIGVDGKFLFIRVLYASTKVLFYRDTDLPLQGRTITSEAKSSTSTVVSKKVVLFQSYPQIPGDFFTTTF